MNFALITDSFISQVQISFVHWHLLHTPTIDMFYELEFVKKFYYQLAKQWYAEFLIITGIDFLKFSCFSSFLCALSVTGCYLI